jgi:hypothetical protein
VIAFHKANGFPPPPVVRDTDTLYDVKNRKLHYALDYQAEVLVPGLYPPRKENGRYVAYLSSATVYADFAGPVVGKLTAKLTEKEAKALTKGVKGASWDTGAFRGYRVERRDGKEVCFVYDPEDKSLFEIRIQLVELDEDDPALLAAAKEAKKKAAAAAPKRQFPKATGKPKNEPLPPALADLAALADKSGLGDIDFEMLEEIEAGGPRAWTNNPAAEHELRVFAQDGSGGLVAFWLVNAAKGKPKPLEQQPVVFLGSEGKVGPVAKDLPDFLTLLALGVGPYEVVEYGASEPGEKAAGVAKILKKHFPDRKKRTLDAILDDASRELGDFEARIDALNKHR